MEYDENPILLTILTIGFEKIESNLLFTLALIKKYVNKIPKDTYKNENPKVLAKKDSSGLMNGVNEANKTDITMRINLYELNNFVKYSFLK